MLSSFAFLAYSFWATHSAASSSRSGSSAWSCMCATHSALLVQWVHSTPRTKSMRFKVTIFSFE